MSSVDCVHQMVCIPNTYLTEMSLLACSIFNPLISTTILQL